MSKAKQSSWLDLLAPINRSPGQLFKLGLLTTLTFFAVFAGQGVSAKKPSGKKSTELSHEEYVAERNQWQQGYDQQVAAINSNFAGLESLIKQAKAMANNEGGKYSPQEIKEAKAQLEEYEPLYKSLKEQFGQQQGAHKEVKKVQKEAEKTIKLREKQKAAQSTIKQSTKDIQDGKPAQAAIQSAQEALEELGSFTSAEQKPVMDVLLNQTATIHRAAIKLDEVKEGETRLREELLQDVKPLDGIEQKLKRFLKGKDGNMTLQEAVTFKENVEVLPSRLENALEVAGELSEESERAQARLEKEFAEQEQFQQPTQSSATKKAKEPIKEKIETSLHAKEGLLLELIEETKKLAKQKASYVKRVNSLEKAALLGAELAGINTDLVKQSFVGLKQRAKEEPNSKELKAILDNMQATLEQDMRKKVSVVEVSSEDSWQKKVKKEPVTRKVEAPLPKEEDLTKSKLLKLRQVMQEAKDLEEKKAPLIERVIATEKAVLLVMKFSDQIQEMEQMKGLFSDLKIQAKLDSSSQAVEEKLKALHALSDKLLKPMTLIDSSWQDKVEKERAEEKEGKKTVVNLGRGNRQ